MIPLALAAMSDTLSRWVTRVCPLVFCPQTPHSPQLASPALGLAEQAICSRLQPEICILFLASTHKTRR